MPSSEKQTPSIVGYNIRRYRLERGWEQDDLAARSGVSQPQISQYESGRTKWPSPEVLRRLAGAFGYDMESFWAPEGDETMPVSLREFLDSGLAPDITPDEVLQLARRQWFSGKPTTLRWLKALDLIRA